MSGSAAHTSIIDDAWDSVVGSFHWLKSVLLGEFQDNRPLSAIIADMLLSFLPAVVIATSARDAIAVILRMTKHPEKREELMEWIVLCACLITIALPLVMAAAGAAAAGVGAVVGGIAGSELGAALRAVMLLLAKQSAKLVEVIQFLQKFIRGDILKFLRAIKFTKYNQAIISAFRQFALKLLEIVQGMIRHLEALPSIQYTRTIIAKLRSWERGFYAVQQSAVRNIPLALAELDARLTRVLAETLPCETHAVASGVRAPKATVSTPARQQVRDVPGRIFREQKTTAARSTNTGHRITTTPAAHPPPEKPSLKDVPDQPKPLDAAANRKAQQIHDPTAEINEANALNKESKPYSNPKNRPKYGENQVDSVWENAKQPDGNVYDPNTGELLTWDKNSSRSGQWDMGHKPGQEYRKLHKDYMDGKITTDQFLEKYRDPNNYQPEAPSANRSHRYEGD